jgi:hypothetical protein
MTSTPQPSRPVAISALTPPAGTSSSEAAAPAGFPRDVVILLDVLARIEQRRQVRLWALRLKEAS